MAVQLVHKHCGSTDSAQIGQLTAQVIDFVTQGLHLIPGIGLHGLHLPYLCVMLHELGFHLVISVGASRKPCKEKSKEEEREKRFFQGKLRKKGKYVRFQDLTILAPA